MAGKKSTKKNRSRKYLFVTGGVMSGIGKGVAASSIGAILEARGLKVTAIKIDPYINVDAGTMNPTEHGEVFVLDDGYETDQDMGNYERFLNVTLPSINYMTTGVVYQEVIRRERNLEYKGKNVQVVPDIPLEIIRRIETAAETANADVTIIEVGGTVGEYENILFIEALRMMKTKMPEDVFTVMVSYLPVPGHLGEMKTKPTQHASRTLNSVGVQADIIIARGEVALDQKRKEKIAIFCNVQPKHVISAPDANIYDVPLNFVRDELDDSLCELMGLKCNPKADLSEWKRFVTKSKNTKGEVKIAVVGKYFKSGDFLLSDVYISVLEAIKFSAYKLGVKPVIEYVSSRDFEKGGADLSFFKKFDGVLVPGGFGTTGIEGKIRVIEYVRKHKIPYFGICYGMQLAAVEFARNVAKMKDASTAEITPKAHERNIIDVMLDQKEKLEQGDYGGTMRLGAYPAKLKKGTHAIKAYGSEKISERHRHRYEVNPEFIPLLEEAGMIFSGTSPDGRLMEIAELPKKMHPFFVGVQFHPEFLARPLDPHPLFTAFIKAAKDKK